jgi:hypothetical protein
MTKLMKNSLFGGQMLRTMGHVVYGGAEIGECLATPARIDRLDGDLWYDEAGSLPNRRELLKHPLNGIGRSRAEPTLLASG